MNNIANQAWEFFKINFKWLLIVVAILVLYFQGCFRAFQPQPPSIHSDTVHIQQQQPIIVVPPYVPQQGSVSYPVYLPSNAQGVIPAATVEELVKQVQLLNERVTNLGTELYAKREYNDSLQLKDSTGKRVGVVKSDYSVSENKLQKIGHSYQLSFPLTTITTTITQAYKPRNKVYPTVGLSNLGIGPTINQLDGGLTLINKRDILISGSYVYSIPQKSSGFRISIGKLLSLRKTP